MRAVMRHRISLLFVLALCSITSIASIGCSSSSSSGDNGDSGSGSACGQPSDKGNSKGVGQYCTAQGTCPPTAPVCSTIQNPNQPANEQTFFCVLPCNACSPPGFCGEGASCKCNSVGCGCVPDTCSVLGTAPDAGAGCTDDAGGDGGDVGGGG
jgi:hypothetical protein